ncbi:hypothetical protein BD413DRAFT_541575 [Trametes elegans]|nr:hypothetical protein BD413DRAFT_541575 [Trametes elegans]
MVQRRVKGCRACFSYTSMTNFLEALLCPGHNHLSVDASSGNWAAHVLEDLDGTTRERRDSQLSQFVFPRKASVYQGLPSPSRKTFRRSAGHGRRCNPRPLVDISRYLAGVPVPCSHSHDNTACTTSAAPRRRTRRHTQGAPALCIGCASDAAHQKRARPWREVTAFACAAVPRSRYGMRCVRARHPIFWPRMRHVFSFPSDSPASPCITLGATSCSGRCMSTGIPSVILVETATASCVRWALGCFSGQDPRVPDFQMHLDTPRRSLCYRIFAKCRI